MQRVSEQASGVPPQWSKEWVRSGGVVSVNAMASPPAALSGPSGQRHDHVESASVSAVSAAASITSMRAVLIGLGAVLSCALAVAGPLVGLSHARWLLLVLRGALFG